MGYVDAMMPTPAERRALLFSATLLLLGGAVRTSAALSGPPGASAREQADLDRQLQSVDSARAQGQRKKAKSGSGKSGKGGTRARPIVRAGSATSQDADTLPATIYYNVPRDSVRRRSGNTAPSEPVDLDVASAAAIERLPRIGPVLARRIVADRDSLGPFGSMKGLQRVRGVGAGLARKLAPYVTFSLLPRPQRVDDPGERGVARNPPHGRKRAPRSP